MGKRATTQVWRDFGELRASLHPEASARVAAERRRKLPERPLPSPFRTNHDPLSHECPTDTDPNQTRDALHAGAAGGTSDVPGNAVSWRAAVPQVAEMDDAGDAVPLRSSHLTVRGSSTTASDPTGNSNGQGRIPMSYGEDGESRWPDHETWATQGFPVLPDFATDDLVARLRQSHVDFGQYAGLVEHQFAACRPWSAEVVAAASSLGDRYFQAGMNQPQLVTKHHRMMRQISDEACELLQEVAPDIPYSMQLPSVFVFQVAPTDVPTLPPQYAYKGGVARKALARALGWNIQCLPVRDLDLIRLGEACDPLVERRLAESLMQEDYLFARRSVIEYQPNLKGYWKTREFGVNEVILWDGQVICTLQCLADAIGGAVRPTRNHMHRNRGKVDGMVACKAVRFFAEGCVEGRAMRLPKFVTFRRRRAIPFQFALHLSRALAHSTKTAQLYMLTCHERGLAPFRPSGDLQRDLGIAARLAHLDRSFFGS